VDDIYTLFVNTIAQYRNMDAKKVAETEGQLYYGQKGIDIGFADRLGTIDMAVAEMEALVRPTEQSIEEQSEKIPEEFAGDPMVVRLSEARAGALASDAFADSKDDSLHVNEVVVLEEGWSLNGRYWTAEAVADISRLMNGRVPGFWCHGEDHRDPRDWAVTWERSWIYKNTCKGALHVFAKPDGAALKERIDYVRQHKAGHLFGVSVDALVRQEVGEMSGRRGPIVRRAHKVYCVDVVMVPAAGVVLRIAIPHNPVSQRLQRQKRSILL